MYTVCIENLANSLWNPGIQWHLFKWRRIREAAASVAISAIHKHGYHNNSTVTTIVQQQYYYYYYYYYYYDYYY